MNAMMSKGTVFEFDTTNGGKAIGIVVDTIDIDGDAAFEYTSTYLCYSQNRLFYLIVSNKYAGIDPETHDAAYYVEHKVGNTVIEYVILPEYDEAIAHYEEEQSFNHRMILIESTSGITVEQEVKICEAISNIVGDNNKHVHIMFDRHFADKELCDKYNLVYTELED